MPLAALFPGQGSIVPGAGRPWADHPSWSVVDAVESVAGRPVAPLLLDDDEATAEALRRTDAAQLATLTLSLVAWDAVRPAVDRDDLVAVAGHSLGQVTALIAAGAVAFDDGVRLAVARADACRAADDARPGRLAALIAATPEQAADLCAATPGCWVANDNAPGQVVVGGTPEALLAAAEAAPSFGVRKVLPLGVGGAFHTPLMAGAADALRPVLDRTPFGPPTVPIVDNTDAAVHGTVHDGSDWPGLLARHLVEPVRWRDVQRVLVDDLGATAVVELAPAGTLTAMAKRTIPEVELIALDRLVGVGA